VTGLLGAGYTGSYIFSQTLFAMRAGVATRLHSWIIAAMELGMFALPFSVRTLLPALGVQGACDIHGASLPGWTVAEVLEPQRVHRHCSTSGASAWN